MKSLEEFPERMRRIRHAPVSERIACEHVGELVVHKWRRRVQHRLQRQPQQNRSNAHHDETQYRSPANAFNESVNGPEKPLPRPRNKERAPYGQHHSPQFKR